MPEAFFIRGRPCLLRTLGLIAVCLLASCGGSASGPLAPVELPAELGTGLAWPPPEEAVLRSASDDVQSLPGDAFSLAGGEFTADDEAGTLMLENGETLSYAIYGMADFGPTLAFSGFNVHLHSMNAEDPAPQPRYVGVANYAKARWEFYRKLPPTVSETLINPADYVSPAGNAYIAVVQSGGDGTVVDSVEFIRTGDTSPPAVPENLVATADVGSITLSWDPVENAGGYFIYRSLQPDFSSPIKLNEVKVPDPAYVDDTVLKEVMYYYRVSAKRAVESGLSNMVDIFSPKTDLAAPQNPRFTKRTPTSTTVAWDWDDVNPAFGFMLYYKTHANFNLEDPVIEKQVPAFARSSILEGIEPHELLYWRVAARGTQEWLGRMTDDIVDPSAQFHQWSEPRVVSQGIGPVSAVLGDDGVTAVFLGAPSTAPGAVVTANIQDDNLTLANVVDSGFGECCDIAFGDRGYIVTMQQLDFRDIWTATGSVGEGWTSALLAGDSAVNLVDEGRKMHIASNGSEYSVAYLKIAAFAGLQLIFQTLPADSDVWTQEIIDDVDVDNPDYLSLMYEGDDVTMVWYASLVNELRFGTRSTDWAFGPIISGQESAIGAFNDIHKVNNRYYTPVLDATEKSLKLYSSETGPWEFETVSLEGFEVSGHCRMQPFGAGLVLAYRMINPPMWIVAVFDGENWSTEWPLTCELPAATLPGLVVDDSTVYLFYEDLQSEQVSEVHVDYAAP